MCQNRERGQRCKEQEEVSPKEAGGAGSESHSVVNTVGRVPLTASEAEPVTVLAPSLLKRGLRMGSDTDFFMG